MNYILYFYLISITKFLALPINKPSMEIDSIICVCLKLSNVVTLGYDITQYN